MYNAFSMLHLVENPMEIGYLVPEIQAVKGFANNRKQRKFFFSISCISKSVSASFSSFCLITSQMTMKVHSDFTNRPLPSLYKLLCMLQILEHVMLNHSEKQKNKERKKKKKSKLASSDISWRSLLRWNGPFTQCHLIKVPLFGNASTQPPCLQPVWELHTTPLLLLSNQLDAETLACFVGPPGYPV